MLSVGCYPAWLVVALATLGALASATTGVSRSVPTWTRYVPLAASLLVFGLPHGAVDHLVPDRVRGRSVTWRGTATVGVVYLLLGGGYAALWTVAPLASAALFVGLTWLHWGQGDLYALDALGSGHLNGGGVRAGTVLVRGGLPMLVPLLGHPARYRAVVDAWVALFGRDLDGIWPVTAEVRLALGGAFAALTLGTLLAGFRRAADRNWRLDVAETVLLWGYFLIVPPLMAVGLYFCVWHSLRHVVRLVAVDTDGARAVLSSRGVLQALRRTGRDAAPLTGVSVVLLVGVGVARGVRTDPAALAALYLVFVAVLTLPHVAVVTWMDLAEGVGLGWSPAEQ